MKPRRTSSKEVSERVQEAVTKQEKVNVMAILADPHPEKCEDYAIRVFYMNQKRRTPFFECTARKVDSNMEDVYLTINETNYRVNIRNGVVVNI